MVDYSEDSQGNATGALDCAALNQEALTEFNAIHERLSLEDNDILDKAHQDAIQLFEQFKEDAIQKIQKHPTQDTMHWVHSKSFSLIPFDFKKQYKDNADKSLKKAHDELNDQYNSYSAQLEQKQCDKQKLDRNSFRLKLDSVHASFKSNLDSQILTLQDDMLNYEIVNQLSKLRKSLDKNNCDSVPYYLQVTAICAVGTFVTTIINVYLNHRNLLANKKLASKMD